MVAMLATSTVFFLFLSLTAADFNHKRSFRSAKAPRRELITKYFEVNPEACMGLHKVST